MIYELDYNVKFQQNSSSGLKETLHLKFVRYLDLFCVLWLISRDKLRIYNPNTYNSLLLSLKKVKDAYNYNTGAQEYDSLYHNISLFEWKPIFQRFIYNVQIKFEFKPRSDLKYDGLSPEDYRECALSLGRDPVGLCSLLKRCTCRFHLEKNKSNSEKVNSLDHSDYDVVMCESCVSNGESIRGPVALVSPFIISNSTPNYSKKRVHKKAKISRNKTSDYSFEDNNNMYSELQYPLHRFLSKPDQTPYFSNESVCNHYVIGDTIFKLVDFLLSVDISSANVGHDVYLFVKILEEQLEKLNKTDEFSKSLSLPESNIFQTLLAGYEELFNNVARLTPFPTVYWLVDKYLNNAVSSLEGSGTIGKFQSLIDNIISQYNNNGNRESKIVIKRIIEDHLFYICRRFQLVHPMLIELFYNIFFNMDIFSKSNDCLEPVDTKKYITPTSDVYTCLFHRVEQEITKVLGILNTLRAYGIGGNKNFFRIKCLHTNLSFELAEGSYIGGLVARELL